MAVNVYGETDNTAEPDDVHAPPPEVAGAEALNPPDVPTITIRDRTFRLTTTVPGKLLLRMAAAAQRAERSDAGGMELAASLNSLIDRLVHPDDRYEFNDFLESAEPAIEAIEVGRLPGQMLAAISARPTQSLPLSSGISNGTP